MSFQLTHGNYVKFVRTTAAVWANYSNESKNNDTLYFVLNAANTSGDLYLGSTLITSNVSPSISFNDLTDVVQYNPSNLTGGSFIVWDTTTQKWTAATPTEVGTIISNYVSVMLGATALDNGLKGLVPTPTAGQQNFVLNGSGVWVDPTILIDARINAHAADWFDDDWDTTNSVASKTIREIAAEEVASIVDNAPDAFDTLKEVAEWIASNPTTGNITNLSNRVDGLDSRVSTLESTVFGTPADPENNIPATPSLLDRINTNATNITNLQTDVTNILAAISWQILTETE